MTLPIRIPVKRLPHAEGLPLPKPMTPGSAGSDIRAAIPDKVTILPGQRIAIPTGFVMEIPRGYEGQVRPRSGLALEKGITLPNAPGTIDSDYRGEVKVILANTGNEPVEIARGDRIAQIVIGPVTLVEWVEEPELEGSGRGVGGFGHTGRV